MMSTKVGKTFCGLIAAASLLFAWGCVGGLDRGGGVESWAGFIIGVAIFSLSVLLATSEK